MASACTRAFCAVKHAVANLPSKDLRVHIKQIAKNCDVDLLILIHRIEHNEKF
jgi:hypothetical protein